MPKDDSLNNLMYNGIAGNQLNQGSVAQGNWAPNWGLDTITTVLANDAYNQQRIAELLEQIPCITFFADVPIPFTGTPGEVVPSGFQGTSDVFVVSAAQTDVSVGSVRLESQSLSQLLTRGNVLISALASTAQDANRFNYWPNPVLIPAGKRLEFTWTNDDDDPAEAGTFSMKGRIIKGGDPALIQELINRLNNMPYWINIPIEFTETALEGRTGSFDGIGNPLVILGAQVDIQTGVVIIDVENLSSQLSKSPVRLLSVAGLSGSIQPIEVWPQPVIIPPNTNISFTFTNDATTPAPAGQLALFGRVLRQQ